MYGYINAIEVRPGHRDEVVAILLDGLDGLREVGCLQYTVAVDHADEVTIRVTEAWESEQAHRASLELPEAEAAIARAMPLLTGRFESTATEVRGGFGL
ncbi:MAG TPA: putative quinol monooxygenase [Solirubrobacterales bacterium]